MKRKIYEEEKEEQEQTRKKATTQESKPGRKTQSMGGRRWELDLHVDKDAEG